MTTEQWPWWLSSLTIETRILQSFSYPSKTRAPGAVRLHAYTLPLLMCPCGFVGKITQCNLNFYPEHFASFLDCILLHFLIAFITVICFALFKSYIIQNLSSKF